MAKEHDGRLGGDDNTGRKNPPSNRGGGRSRDRYPGRTSGSSATSYSSVGGPARQGRHPEKTEGIDEEKDVVIRPAPGGVIEEANEGIDVPFTGEVASTRGSTFEENPDTGLTPEEERERLLTQSLEKRTRRHESG